VRLGGRKGIQRGRRERSANRIFLLNSERKEGEKEGGGENRTGNVFLRDQLVEVAINS